MGKRKKRGKVQPKRQRRAAGAVQQDEPRVAASTKPEMRTRQVWLSRALAALLVPTLVFGACELGLRLSGYGYPTAFVLQREVGGSPALVNNPFFTWRFFGKTQARESLPICLSEDKDEHTYRIFVVGASAAQGDPEPAYSIARMLELMLSQQYPGVDFEVVNTGITAINSHVVLPMSRACCHRLEADLLVVYLGNNEVIGPFGAASTPAPLSDSLALIRLRLALASTRLGQLLESLLTHPGSTGSEHWAGMETFLDKQLRNTDPVLTTTYHHFEHNLRDIRGTAVAAGVPVLLCTVAVNLQDCPPFASLHREDLSPQELQEWQSAYDRGVAEEASGAYLQAAASYAQAAVIDPTYADLSFRLARCRLQGGEVPAAQALFARARDHDTLRFRADTRINEIIRRVAAPASQPLVRLADVASDLDGLSPDQAAEDELFLDHVHFTFSGSYHASRSILEQLRNLLPKRITRLAAERRLLQESECARQLAYTGWNRHGITSRMLDRMRRPPFTNQIDHHKRISSLTARAEHLAVHVRPGAQLRQAQEQHLDALRVRPDDWLLHFNLAFIAWSSLGDATTAERHLRFILEHNPTFTYGHAHLADVLLELGRYTEAEVHLRTVLEYKPRLTDGWINLGISLVRQGKVADAIPCFRRALKLEPSSDTAHYFYARALLELEPDDQGARRLAAEHLRQTLELNPSHHQARQALELLQ